MKPTSLYLGCAEMRALRRLAQRRGYVVARGPGAGEQPSVSKLLWALAGGEIVAAGPFPRWADVLSALDKALALTALSDAERAALAGLRDQVEAEANLDDDDV